jgi:hypothetical protein
MVAPGLVFLGAYDGEYLIAGGPGLVGYEQQGGGPGGGFRMYASATGRDWAPLQGPNFGPSDIARQLSIVGQRFIITGGKTSGTGYVPRVWASMDGGQTWRESPQELQIDALVRGADGLLAFVSARSATDLLITQLWTSANGVMWRQLPDPNGAFASGFVTSVAEGGPGYVAGGYISEEGGSGHATVWTSKDGLTWAEVPDAGNAFAGSVTAISQVVAGPAGFAAAGEAAGKEGDAIWASKDGIHWRRAADAFVTTPQLPSLPLAVWQGGFVEIQDVGTGADLYSSPDGVTWTRLGSDEVFGGSAWVTGMIAYGGALVAIGGYASHPRAQCVRATGSASGSFVIPDPSAFLWTPDASQTAPAPALDPTDPWALRLLPKDFPSGFFGPSQPPFYQGQFVNLCAYLPALGRHRAYLLSFDTGARGLALDIVTQRTAAAKAAFRQVDHLITQAPWTGALEPAVTVQRTRELRTSTRIGDQTRAFTIHVKDYECGDLLREAGIIRTLDCATSYYDADVVAWRHGRVIGVVVADESRSFATELARNLLARSEHPTD